MASSIRKEAEASAFICIKKKMSDCEKTVNFVMKAFLDSPLAFEPSYILAVGLIYLETRVASRPEPTL